MVSEASGPVGGVILLGLVIVVVVVDGDGDQDVTLMDITD